MYRCDIYETRPTICRLYPAPEAGGKMPGCSYRHGKYGLIGECSRCGKCCLSLEIDIHGIGKNFEPGLKCPYLKLDKQGDYNNG